MWIRIVRWLKVFWAVLVLLSKFHHAFFDLGLLGIRIFLLDLALWTCLVLYLPSKTNCEVAYSYPLSSQSPPCVSGWTQTIGCCAYFNVQGQRAFSKWAQAPGSRQGAPLQGLGIHLTTRTCGLPKTYTSYQNYACTQNDLVRCCMVYLLGSLPSMVFCGSASLFW